MTTDRRQMIIIIAGIALILILAILTTLLGNAQQVSTSVEENTVQEAYIDENVVLPPEVSVSKVTKIFLDRGVSVVSSTDYTFNVIFPRDLFDEEGNSEEEFFYELVDALSQEITHDFELIDSQKGVRIKVTIDQETGAYTVVFNDNEKFYDVVNGSSYIAIDKAEMVEPQSMYEKSALVAVLDMNDYYFKYVEEYLEGESKQLDDGYLYYPDEGLKFLIQPNKAVMNVVFDDTYEGLIIDDVDIHTSLLEISEKYENFFAGGVNSGFLAYRNARMYLFFYPGEVSYYSYSTDSSKKIDQLIEQYVSSKELGQFVSGMKRIMCYTEFEYNEEEGRFKASYPTRGINIDIRNNDSLGISIYNNYLAGDKTKQLVKDGKITFVDQDSVYLYEKDRINK